MNEILTYTLFLIFKKVLLIIALLSFVFSDDSWKVYDESDLAYIHITVDPEDLEWMYDNVESDSMHLASLQFQNAFINETVDSIGFRLRGNTSRNADKKSFKVDFNHFISGREFYGLQKLNLNGEHSDPSIIRSKLSWDFYEDIGMKSSRASHATLYINNEYFGLYISIEHIDDTFLTRNFENDKGNLWKCIWPADLTYRGNEPDDYHPYYSETRPYELKTNKNDYEYVKLARLINVIHETPDSLEMVLDIKTTLQYFAMNVLTGSWDDYRFLRNNFYLYHNPDDDLIYWLPFDYDNSFGIDWFNIDWSTIDPYEYAVIDNDGRPLTDYLFSQQRYRNLFSHFLQFYNQQLFHLDSIYETLNNFSDHLYSAAEYDIYRTLDYGFSINDFLNSYGSDYENAHVKQGILEFIAERKESLNDQIAFDGYNPIIYESSIEQNIMMIGESINVKASIWGNVLNAQFFYRHVNEEEWSSVPLFFNPITESKRVEDHDQWLAEFIPLQSGDYNWYILASNETEDEKFPVYNDRSFEVLNPITNQSLLINEILAEEVDNWHSYGDSLTAHLMGRQKIKSWYENVLPMITDPQGVEVDFNKILIEDDERVVYLRGTIDLVEPHMLWDWKFPKADYTRDRWQYDRWDVQSIAYTWAMGIPYFRFGVMHNKGWGTMDFLRDDSHYEWLRKKVASICRYVETNTGPYLLGDNGWWCSEKWCPSWTQCKGKKSPEREE